MWMRSCAVCKALLKSLDCGTPSVANADGSGRPLERIAENLSRFPANKKVCLKVKRRLARRLGCWFSVPLPSSPASSIAEKIKGLPRN
jgi:hypothetical protein